MGKLKVHDMNGKAVSELDFADDMLISDKGEQAVRDVVVAMMAARRAGTASTLSKGEVAGSNKKPWQQKGLGRARAGYRQSPVWRGGAVAFGPHPRSYAQKINKKVLKLAFKRAFSDVVREERVMVVDELMLSEGKTKIFADIMKKLQLVGATVFVVDKIDKKTMLASRNIPKTEMVSADNLNVYQLLRYKNVVVTKSAMDVIKVRFGDVETVTKLETKAEELAVEKG
jgi:large subunit ribosomal protein L4